MLIQRRPLLPFPLNVSPVCSQQELVSGVKSRQEGGAQQEEELETWVCRLQTCKGLADAHSTPLACSFNSQGKATKTAASEMTSMVVKKFLKIVKNRRMSSSTWVFAWKFTRWNCKPVGTTKQLKPMSCTNQGNLDWPSKNYCTSLMALFERCESVQARGEDSDTPTQKPHSTHSENATFFQLAIIILIIMIMMMALSHSTEWLFMAMVVLQTSCTLPWLLMSSQTPPNCRLRFGKAFY